MPKKLEKMKDIHVYIGNKIKQYRYELGLSRAELSNKIHISGQQLAKYEDGVNKICIGRLLLLAKVFNKNINDFLNVSDMPVDVKNLSRIDLELIKNFTNIKDKELKEIINKLIAKINKKHVKPITTNIEKL